MNAFLQARCLLSLSPSANVQFSLSSVFQRFYCHRDFVLSRHRKNELLVPSSDARHHRRTTAATHHIHPQITPKTQLHQHQPTYPPLLVSSVPNRLDCCSLTLVETPTQTIKMPPTSRTQPLYAIGEKTLCFHGPVLYDAKVVESRQTDESDRKSPWEYFVHYQGWKKS